MHRFYAPIALDTVRDEKDYAEYVRQFRAAEVERVFVCGVGEIKAGEGAIFEDPARVERLIRRLQQDGFEVGIWINALGHGEPLLHEFDDKKPNELCFTPIVGLDGRSSPKGLCPADEKLRAHFAKSLQIVAAMHPDIIMLDDDFRLNVRDGAYDIGCFCAHHMTALCDQLGETVTREELYEKAFTGGENRYRSAWMALMSESLLGFARAMRRAVDAIAPEVRLGVCMCYDTWDMDGTDGMELARALAGGTKPFLRTIGAPYHNRRVAAAVECTRMQAAWCRDSGIEVFAEGDVYPRPRYTVPAAGLELFDLALYATGAVEADQKYMFDYSRRVGYENGYVARHLKNAPIRCEFSAIFADKKPVGVQVFEPMRKMQTWDMPRERSLPVGRYIHKNFYPKGAQLLAEQAIPTAYEQTGYPVMLFGESARHVALDALACGAVLDAAAAKILTERGMDVGLISAERATFAGEYFGESDDAIMGLGGTSLMRLEVKDGAEVDSLLLPERTPGAYRYTNADGLRFFVLALDAYNAPPSSLQVYQNNYYRGKQLVKALEWVGKKPLPAVCTGHPYLYMICAKNADESALSVALFNVFEDEVLAPEITLDKAYSTARFVNCNGQLKGNKIALTDISPFGVAAFEVK